MSLSKKFQNLHNNREVPQDLEKEIISSYSKLKLAADIADLFVVQFARTGLQIISDLDDSDKVRGQDPQVPPQRPGANHGAGNNTPGAGNL